MKGTDDVSTDAMLCCDFDVCEFLGCCQSIGFVLSYLGVLVTNPGTKISLCFERKPVASFVRV